MRFTVKIFDSNETLIQTRGTFRATEAVEKMASAINYYSEKNESVNIKLLDERGVLILSATEKFFTINPINL